MAKYSTGGASGSDDASSCELCGTATESLRPANVAGAKLQVCRDCTPHADTAHTDEKRDSDSQEPDRNRRAARNAASIQDARQGDSERWEQQGPNYDDDQLPYLVSDYGDRLQRARQDAGLQLPELAEELDVPETHLLAVEQGRAARAGVGGSLVAALEDRFDVTLAE